HLRPAALRRPQGQRRGRPRRRRRRPRAPPRGLPPGPDQRRRRRLAGHAPAGRRSAALTRRANMTTSDKDLKLITDQWLTAELNRMWLVAERTLRSLQKAQIRPQPGHPTLAEVEGVLTARRVARLGGKAAG